MVGALSIADANKAALPCEAGERSPPRMGVRQQLGWEGRGATAVRARQCGVAFRLRILLFAFSVNARLLVTCFLPDRTHPPPYLTHAMSAATAHSSSSVAAAEKARAGKSPATFEVTSFC